jgi:hypothetical protein
MKRIMILLAAMAMTTLVIQANDTMNSVGNAIEKAVYAVTPTTATEESQAIEAAKQAAAEEQKKEEEKKALENK